MDKNNKRHSKELLWTRTIMDYIGVCLRVEPTACYQIEVLVQATNFDRERREIQYTEKDMTTSIRRRNNALIFYKLGQSEIFIW